MLPKAVVVAICLLAPAYGDAASQTQLEEGAADLSADTHVARYRVTGATASELRSSMLMAGPEKDGRRWFGMTDWEVQWQFRYEPTESGCSMEWVGVEFSSRMTLPVWDGERGADPALVREWRVFARALRMHEEGHTATGLRAAREIRRRLQSVRANSCRTIAEEANSTAHEILDHFRQREREYDRETGHGRTQGAVWPPRIRESAQPRS